MVPEDIVFIVSCFCPECVVGRISVGITCSGRVVAEVDFYGLSVFLEPWSCSIGTSSGLHKVANPMYGNLETTFHKAIGILALR